VPDQTTRSPFRRLPDGEHMRMTKINLMIELFINLTDQLYWGGYARQLANDDTARFRAELKEFLDTYQNDHHGG